jgi:signal transduction histidine kinase/CHASE3 domain sensor protein
MKKKKINSRSYVTFGFALVIVLLVAIIVLWKYNNFIREQQVKLIEQHQFEYRAIGMLLHNAHLRSITLYKMTSLEDPFELDDAYLEFQKYGENLMKQRDILVTLNFEPEEKAIWDDVREVLNTGYKSQYDVIKLIHDGRISEASKKIARVIIPIQDKLQKKLDELSEVKANQLDRAKIKAKKLDVTINIYIYLLSFACVLLAVLTMVVTRKTTETETALASQAKKIRALYEVASQPHESVDAQIDDTLKVGCKLFDLEIGKLCKIDSNQQINKMINVVVPENFNTILQKNMEVPLERTFCSIPFNEEKIVLLHNIATSDYKTYPCYEFANLGTYIAAPIYVYGKKYGTINFSSFKARKISYKEADHDLLYLIGKFISVVIETQLSQEMIIDKKAADEANEAKSRFLSNMSHELRTPLNAIIGYSDLILSEANIADDTTQEDIKRINKAGYHLLHLVNNILDISKVEAGKMTIEPVDFNIDSLLDITADIAYPMISENNNKLTIKNNVDDGQLFTDRQKLKQILLNLLSNAAKFTHNGEITIACNKLFRSGKECLSILVKDTGTGMSEDAQKHIFDEFAQDLSNDVARHSGTGLGLSICKAFALLMGGDITVISKKGEGSEFRVTIPVKYGSENYGALAKVN